MEVQRPQGGELAKGEVSRRTLGAHTSAESAHCVTQGAGETGVGTGSG